MNCHKLEKIIIAVVAAHSFVLGAALLTRPEWTLSLANWDYEGNLFFPAQSGVFLVLFSGVYLEALRRRSFAWLLVATKAVAFFFLITTCWIGIAPPMSLVAASFDGLMGLAVFLIVVYNTRQEHRHLAESPEPSENQAQPDPGSNLESETRNA